MRALFKNRDRVIVGRSERSLPVKPIVAALRRDKGAFGLVNVRPEPDQVYRALGTCYRAAEQEWPTLAGAALLRSGVATPPDDMVIAPWRHPETIPTYGLAAVLACARAGEPDAAALASAFGERVVFIGSTLPDEDRKLTSARFIPAVMAVDQAVGEACPLRRLPASNPNSRSVPGVFLHALVAESVLNGAVTIRAAALWKTLLAVLSAVLGAVVSFRRGPWIALGVAIAWGGAVWLLELAVLYGDLWLSTAPAILAIFGTVAVAYVVRFLTEERKRRQVQHAFGHYVAPALVDRLVEQPGALELGGSREDVTIMFADLSGFTALSGRIGPEELVARTNAYLQIMADEIDATGGYVDKYIGDAVMAMWGAPNGDPRHPLRSVEAALAMVAEISRRREEALHTGEHAFDVKIGINSGPAVVGNVGSERRYNYTAVGEAVNISSRLEGLPGVYGCRIIIGPDTAEFVRDEIVLREIDSVIVKGRDTPLRLFEPLGPLAEVGEADRRRVQDYETALADYRAQRFAEAIAIWTRLEDDGPAAVMADRALRFIEEPPPPDWDGVWVMTTK